MMMAKENEGKWQYDVFVSFRGLDTRYGFVGNLHNALRQKRFKTFVDEGGLKCGDHIFASILKALEDSRISIIVLSTNYASSWWCLQELVHALECKKNKNQLVLPIFYNVDPSEVRHLKGSLVKTITQLQSRYGPYRVNIWASALSQVADLSGFRFQRCQLEYELIVEIVEWVSKHVPRYVVFLSFSGEDTRYSFAGFLYNALRKAGFETFMNDEERVSREIIEGTRLSIVVFSENYPRSSSRLDELVAILDRMKVENQLLVWPIFYRVKPSELRHQRNSYGEAMTAHENMFGKTSEKVRKWREALSEAANLKGWYLSTGYEYEHINKIVEMALKV